MVDNISFLDASRFLESTAQIDGDHPGSLFEMLLKFRPDFICGPFGPYLHEK